AIRLEAVARGPMEAVAPYEVSMTGRPLHLDTPGLIRAVVADRDAGRPAAEIAAAFHAGVALAIARVCRRLREETGLRRVAISGGVFQNGLIMERVLSLLDAAGLDAYANRDVPANDGGISLGQALVAAAGGGRDPGLQA